MFRKLMKIAGVLLLAIFIAGTLAFTANETSEVICRSIEISFYENEAIKVSKDELVRLVDAADNKLLSKKMNEINAEIIEQEVEKHQAILKADAYKLITKDSTNYKGVLVIRVKHREPIVRVMSASGSYYLDEFGGKIPISANYTANVLVATGYFSEEFATKQLLPFILYIENNEFWKAQIEQIHVESGGDILLTPLVGEHIIELGKLDDYTVKLLKMRAFYDQVLAKNNWDKYKTVSLKYNNQVIAKRK